MKTTTIYRTAIINKNGDVTYLSNIFFSNRDTAIKQVEKLKCNKEEEIDTHKWIEVCVRIGGRYNWKTFEKIKNDNNKRYFGIITEILIDE